MIRDQIPYEMVSGGTIDSGEIPELFEAAIKRADVAGFAKRVKYNPRRKTSFRVLALVCILSNVVAVQMRGLISNFRMMDVLTSLARSSVTVKDIELQ